MGTSRDGAWEVQLGESAGACKGGDGVVEGTGVLLDVDQRHKCCLNGGRVNLWPPLPLNPFLREGRIPISPGEPPKICPTHVDPDHAKQSSARPATPVELGSFGRGEEGYMHWPEAGDLAIGTRRYKT